MEHNSDNTLIHLATEIDSPVSAALRDEIEFALDQDDLNIRVDQAAHIAGETIKLVADEISLTPSVNDIYRFFRIHFPEFLSRGLSATAVGLIEAYVIAGFGFTGHECEEIDTYYGGLEEQETLY